jgi:hypothetical protein
VRIKDLSKSPYKHYLEDPDFNRWYENVKRGSVVTAHDWLRRIGRVCTQFNKTPKEIAQMDVRTATNFILDVVSALERDGYSSHHIANCTYTLKNWLAFNGINIQQRIKISKGELTRVSEERPPTQDELRKIFSAAELRAKAACALVAFSGLRIESLGDYQGQDGLQVKDFPEMVIENNAVEFAQMPAMIAVRRSISKAGHQYFTFLCDEGCEYLKEYLGWRLRKGEKLTNTSPIITPTFSGLVGKHITSVNIGDLMRKAIRVAGFSWRPYVLRRYFDVRMMMAESDGLIIRDWRVFWMGHKGDIEHTYTVNKGLPQDVIEKMRESYQKAAEKCLVTTKKETVSQETIVSTFNKQFLQMAGYSEEEIGQLGNLAELTAEQVQELIRKKSMESLGLNGNRQKIINCSELKSYVENGWEFVTRISDGEAIIALPKDWTMLHFHQ